MKVADAPAEVRTAFLSITSPNRYFFSYTVHSIPLYSIYEDRIYDVCNTEHKM
jgi:hypothetical protein